jgi:hypothetical protein
MRACGSFFLRVAIRLHERLRTSAEYLDELAARTNCSRTLQTVPVWNRASSNRLAHRFRLRHIVRPTQP